MRNRTSAAVMAVGLLLIPATLRAASLKEAAEAVSAASTETLEFSGSGKWFQFGQAPVPGGPWPQFDVSAYAAAIRFDRPAARVQLTRIQTVEPGRARPAPVEQKLEWYVSGDKAWNLAPPQGAAPGAAPVATLAAAAVEERSAEIWATPQGFLRAALRNDATSRPIDGGVEVSFTLGGKYRYIGRIDEANRLVSVKTCIDTPVLGDTLVETSFGAYKDFGGVRFPADISRSEGGHPVLQIKIDAVKANGPVDISVPENIAGASAPAIAVTSTKLADGVYYLTGGTHHSVAVEQKDHVVLIEAPLNEERSLALIDKIAEIAPNKPIKYVINSHVHFDHSGGLRTFVDAGAIVVTQELDKPYYEKAWAAPRTLRPDRLAKSGKAAKFETYSEKHVLGDGARTIEAHHIAGNGHSDDLALIYLPAERLLIEADAYTPLAPGAPAPKTINPYSVNLYENIKKLGLNVERIAGLHGRVATLDELKGVIGQSPSQETK